MERTPYLIDPQQLPLCIAISPDNTYQFQCYTALGAQHTMRMDTNTFITQNQPLFFGTSIRFPMVSVASVNEAGGRPPRFRVRTPTGELFGDKPTAPASAANWSLYSDSEDLSQGLLGFVSPQIDFNAAWQIMFERNLTVDDHFYVMIQSAKNLSGTSRGPLICHTLFPHSSFTQKDFSIPPATANAALAAAAASTWQCTLCKIGVYALAAAIVFAITATASFLTIEMAPVIALHTLLSVSVEAALALIRGLAAVVGGGIAFVATQICAWAGACE